MSKLSIEKIKQLPKSELRQMLNDLKDRIKENEVVQNTFEEYGVDLSELDYVPVAFADLDVSARTQHGCIYLNYKLLEDGNLSENDHYLAHEVVHWLQQCFNDKPTKGSNDGNYLDNEYEQEAFQIQTEFLSDTRDDETAEAYVEKVLDHHEIDDIKDREKRKNKLLRLAYVSDQFLKLVLAGRLDDVINKYPNLKNDISYLANKDPSGNLKYLDWMTKILSSNQVDKDEISHVIELFHKFRNKLDKKDIYQYKPNEFNDLKEKLTQIKNEYEESKSKNKAYMQEVACGNNTVYESDNFLVKHIFNKASSIHYGRDTRWCITMEDKNHFEDYSSDNSIFFFIINKKIEPRDPFSKIALHYERNAENYIINLEILDSKDNLINKNDLLNKFGDEINKILSLTIDIALKFPKSLIAKISSYDKIYQSDVPEIDKLVHENHFYGSKAIEVAGMYELSVPANIIDKWMDIFSDPIVFRNNPNTIKHIAKLASLKNLNKFDEFIKTYGKEYRKRCTDVISELSNKLLIPEEIANNWANILKIKV